jgi:hypothetical protein
VSHPNPAAAQSYQKVSPATFWYDWAQNPYYASYIRRPLDEWDRAENWSFGRLVTRAGRLHLTRSGHGRLDYHVLIDKFTTLAEFDGSVVESSGSCFNRPNMVQFKA